MSTVSQGFALITSPSKRAGLHSGTATDPDDRPTEQHHTHL